MFAREQVEKILTMHGVDTNAPDEDIRAALVSAKWNEKDINAAIFVLRENPNQHRTHDDVLHQISRTDDRLQPETIKSLLGIDVEVSASDISHRKSRSRGSYSVGQIISITLVSLILGVAFLLLAMWYMEIGIFHPTFR